MDKKNILNCKKGSTNFPKSVRKLPWPEQSHRWSVSVVFVQFHGDLTPPEHKRGKGTVMDVHEMSPWSSVHIQSNVQTKIVLFLIDVTFLPAVTTSEHVTPKNCYRNIESSSGNCQQQFWPVSYSTSSFNSAIRHPERNMLGRSFLSEYLYSLEKGRLVHVGHLLIFIVPKGQEERSQPDFDRHTFWGSNMNSVPWGPYCRLQYYLKEGDCYSR